MKKHEWEKQFYLMLSDGGWVGQEFFRKWFTGNPIRLNRLASAMERGEISFRFMRGVNNPHSVNEIISPFPQYKKFLEGQKGRVDLLAYHLDLIDSRVGIELDAPSLLAWLNKTFPLKSSPPPISELPFMSDKLAFAVECSEALYPEGYKSTDEKRKVQADRESGRIRDHLEKHKLTDRARKALIVQLNPVSE